MTHMFGQKFDIAAKTEWVRRVQTHHGPFAYLVTPNVDHLVQLDRDPTLRAAYDRARWHLCDSRILARMARAGGVDLACYPGSDVLRDLLEDRETVGRRIVVLGPPENAIETLRARYPACDIGWIDAPMMRRGDAHWRRCLDQLAEAEFDILVLALSFPKQEQFAADLSDLRRAGGIAICVGAAVDFLTGQQSRAPRVMQRLGLEWLYRLTRNPRRLWRRYLWDGPRIFALAWKTRRQR